MKLDILAFGAHPDDVELSMGGLMIAEAKKGKLTGIIDLTRGELGTRGNSEIRSREADSAASIMGLKVRQNLGMPDGMFDMSKENKLRIIEVIRTHRPEIVFANALHDRHPDHGRAAQLVTEACFLSGLEKLKTPGVNPPWRPRAVYYYMQSLYREPDFIYDISDVIEEKIACIMAHKSQVYDPESAEPETFISSKHYFENITSRASELGLQVGFRYGESFNIARTPGITDIFSLR